MTEVKKRIQLGLYCEPSKNDVRPSVDSQYTTEETKKIIRTVLRDEIKASGKSKEEVDRIVQKWMKLDGELNFKITIEDKKITERTETFDNTEFQQSIVVLTLCLKELDKLQVR